MSAENENKDLLIQSSTDNTVIARVLRKTYKITSFLS